MVAVMIYQSDEQDELIGDAEAVGGPPFAEYVQYRASAEADRLVTWNRIGDEPPARVRAWLDAARRLVDERRAALARRP